MSLGPMVIPGRASYKRLVLTCASLPDRRHSLRTYTTIPWLTASLERLLAPLACCTAVPRSGEMMRLLPFSPP